MTHGLSIIDADAHVIETERTWDYLDAAEQKYRPQLFYSKEDELQQYWVIDGKIRGFRFPTLNEKQLRELSEKTGRRLETPQAARELDDVDLRLEHMDALGIDVQVLHNTLWIEQLTERPEVEAALCRSWNRWLAEVWKKSHGRLRWSCVIPTLTLDEARKQIKEAKENGAVAVCLRPLEGNRHLSDPYFYPIYRTAVDLDLAIAVHIANANPANCELYRQSPVGRFAIFRMPTVAACLNLILSEVPQLFPKLRWGFIEAAAQWIPWVAREAARRFQVAGRKFPDSVFEEYKIYVTCQNNDDIPYILGYSGEGSLLIGTDYGHLDVSTEVDAITEFRRQEGIGEQTKEKILHHNPKGLYGI